MRSSRCTEAMEKRNEEFAKAMKAVRHGLKTADVSDVIASLSKIYSDIYPRFFDHTST